MGDIRDSLVGTENMAPRFAGVTPDTLERSKGSFIARMEKNGNDCWHQNYGMKLQ